MGVGVACTIFVRGLSDWLIYSAKAVHSWRCMLTRPVRPWPPSFLLTQIQPMCITAGIMESALGQHLAHFDVQLCKLTFVLFNYTKGISHNWHCISTYCCDGVVHHEVGVKTFPDPQDVFLCSVSLYLSCQKVCTFHDPNICVPFFFFKSGDIG
eukprot:3494498-Ditylum_brightwellii.AAC.1